MAVKVFQTLVFRIKEILDCDVDITDSYGLVFASTRMGAIGDYNDEAVDFINSNEFYAESENATFMKVTKRANLDYVAVVYGTGQQRKTAMELICLSIENAKLYYEEKFDKNSFMKNVLLGNILPGDISLRARDLKVKDDVRRIIYYIHTEKSKDIHAYNIIQSLFPNDSKDFVILVDAQNNVLVKELKEKEDYDDIYRNAKLLLIH